MASYQIWQEIERWATDTHTRSLRILDLACGGGKITRELKAKAEQQHLECTALGLDINPLSVRYARHAARHIKAGLDFAQANVVTDPLPAGFNVIVCSLFLHHLSNDEAIQLLSRMHRSTAGIWIVSDLVRSPLSYALAHAATRVLSRSPIVREDGARSVRAAFSAEELRHMLQQADVSEFSLRKVFPCRFLIFGTGKQRTCVTSS